MNCPFCGSEHYYEGLNGPSCPNSTCYHFDSSARVICEEEVVEPNIVLQVNDILRYNISQFGIEFANKWLIDAKYKFHKTRKYSGNRGQYDFSLVVVGILENGINLTVFTQNLKHIPWICSRVDNLVFDPDSNNKVTASSLLNGNGGWSGGNLPSDAVDRYVSGRRN